MADEGGETIRRGVGRGRIWEGTIGMVPTGSGLASEGSSVELDADLATQEEIPATEEILLTGEEARRRTPRARKHPAQRRASSRRPAAVPEEEAEKPFIPHDKSPTRGIE